MAGYFFRPDDKVELEKYKLNKEIDKLEGEINVNRASRVRFWMKNSLDSAIKDARSWETSVTNNSYKIEQLQVDRTYNRQTIKELNDSINKLNSRLGVH